MEPQDFFSILDHAWSRSQATLWIATTRHPDLVPKTQAVRPGRFEQLFRFDGPNLEVREQLLRNLPLGISDEYTFRELLEMTETLNFAHFEEMRQICATLLLEQREMEMISTMRSYLQDQILTSDRTGGLSDLTTDTLQRTTEVDPRLLKSALSLTDIFTTLMNKTLSDAFQKANESGAEPNAQ
jgi:SpoVK/Ycf46/Vps4 family AAA+-type ATPase